MKTLKLLYEENGSKGGFWVIEYTPAGKNKFYVIGRSHTEPSLFFLENGGNPYSARENTETFELYTPPKPKTKMLAYVKSEGEIILLEHTTIMLAGYKRAPWLDGEVE